MQAILLAQTVSLEIPVWGAVVLVIGFIGKIVHDHYMQKALDKDLCEFKKLHEKEVAELKISFEKDLHSVTNGFHFEHKQIRDAHDSFKNHMLDELKHIRKEQLAEQKELRKVLEELRKANIEFSASVQYMVREIDSIKQKND